MIWDSLYLLNKNISRKLIGFQESIRSTLSGKHEYSPRFPKIIWCHVDHLFVIIKAPLLAFSRFLWSWKTWLSVHLYLKVEIPTTLWRGTNMPSMDNITVIVTFSTDLSRKPWKIILHRVFTRTQTGKSPNDHWEISLSIIDEGTKVLRKFLHSMHPWSILQDALNNNRNNHAWNIRDTPNAVQWNYAWLPRKHDILANLV